MKNQIGNFSDSLSEKNITYIILIGLYALLLTIQINQPPCERYPGWDWFWVDTMNVGKLSSLKYALSNFELPVISPYINLGSNMAGNAAMNNSFVSPINLLVTFFSPRQVIVIRSVVFLFLGAIGSYLLIELITKEKFISFWAGITYISLPFVISNFYYHPFQQILYLTPLFLYLIHRIFENETIKIYFIFVLFSVFTISSADVYVFIVMPPVIGVYSIFIAFFYYECNFVSSLKKASTLVILFILAGSFFIIPLYCNLKTISSVSSTLSEFGLHAGTPLSLKKYFIFFREWMLPSLYKPIEGSGGVLYAPVFLYFVIAVSLIFKKYIFKGNSRQALIAFVLVLLGVMMFIISIVFYSFPDLARMGKGVLRYHLDLIPHMIILAGFICFNAIKQQTTMSKIILFAIIISGSFLIDYYLFYLQHCSVEGPFYASLKGLFCVNHSLFSSSFSRCSNFISLRFMEDMWKVIPWLNGIVLTFLFLYTLFSCTSKNRKGVKAVYIIVAIGLTFTTISIYNELRLQQNQWQLLTRNSHRMNNYIKRKNCIDKQIMRYDINHRTLLSGLGIYGEHGRNVKAIAETEMHVQEKEKVLFSYRETMHPYTALISNTFVGQKRWSSLWPPVSSSIPDNIEILKLVGVKWIISNDAKIDSPHIIYRGRCDSKGSSFYDPFPESKGTTFLYELKSANGIAFLVDKYKKVGLMESLKAIHENKEYPWLNGLVYLESDPDDGNSRRVDNTNDDILGVDNKAKFVHETMTGFDIKVNAPKETFLVISYLYRPGWEAYINDDELKVYRAYGGFMCVKVPAGHYTVKFKYKPVDVYVGFCLTGCAFMFPFVLWGRRRRLNRRLERESDE